MDWKLIAEAKGRGDQARADVKEEAPDRRQMAKLLVDRADALAKVFGKQTVARYDRWDYVGMPEVTRPTADFWQEVAEVLLEAAEDRDLIFRFTVRDKGALREVARGSLTRRIVLEEDFMRKLKRDPAL